MKGCRYENKYLIGTGAAELMKIQLASLLSRDPHADRYGGYDIRSLYFDDTERSAYYEKLSGVQFRAKYRLRYYNGDASHILLECKQRNGNLSRKRAVPVSRSVAELLIAGEPWRAKLPEAPLLKEFLALRACKRLTPQIIVYYRRTAFLHPVSNLRITVDENVRSSAFRTDTFFRPDAAGIPVMEPNDALLEIKYDTFLLPYVQKVLSQTPATLIANSKYCACLAVCEPD